MKALILHGSLALFGLALAYFAWTADDVAAGPIGESVVTCDRVERLTLRTARKETVVAVGEERTIVTVRVIGEADADAEAAGAEDEAPNPQANPEQQDQTFSASQDIGEYLEKFTPLRALRSLGSLDEGTLEEIGLSEPSDSLVVTCNGRDTTLMLGGSAYGSGDRYARTEGGPVHLIAATTMRDLASAEFELMQRDLTAFDMHDADILVVSGAGRTRHLKQRDRQNSHTAQWVDANEPDRRNELYGNWHRAFQGTRVSRYLDEGQEPGAELEQSEARHGVLQLTYQDEAGETLDVVSIVRLGEGESAQYYARSGATHTWVKLPHTAAARVEQDGRSVLGLPPLVTPTPEPEAAPSEAPAPQAPAPEAARLEAARPEAPAPEAPAPAEPADAPDPTE